MEFLHSFFIEPLSYDFMQRALIVSALIGVACSIFSCFLILKGWSLMGDAVSHAVLPGVALAYMLGVQFALGAFAAGLFCAISIGFVKNNCRVKEDAVMGIIFSGMFALGLVLLTKIETDIHLLHILFGNVLGITTEDMVEAGLIAAIASLVMLIKRRDLLLYCFDPAHAAALGLPVKWLHFGLLVFLAVTIVSALKAAGIILVIAMLIAPGAIGFLLSRSFDRMLAIAVGVSVISCLAGTILSYHMDSATAPLIVVIQSAIFIFVLAISQLKQGRAKADVIAA